MVTDPAALTIPHVHNGHPGPLGVRAGGSRPRSTSQEFGAVRLNPVLLLSAVPAQLSWSLPSPTSLLTLSLCVGPQTLLSQLKCCPPPQIKLHQPLFRPKVKHSLLMFLPWGGGKSHPILCPIPSGPIFLHPRPCQTRSWTLSQDPHISEFSVSPLALPRPER